MSRIKGHPVTFTLALLGLFTLGQAMFLGNSGCSGGAVCYRVTDCPLGDRCISGTCTHRMAVTNDGISAAAGTSAGGSATATGTATAGSGGAATMAAALTSAADAASAGQAGAASLSDAGAGGISGS